MKQKILYLLCGIPGSGKSYWAKNVKNAEIISRDEIRYSLLKDDEDYFSHENEVFNTFIRKINNAIATKSIIIVDATHINEKSRNKVLNRLNLDNVAIIPVNFELPLDKVLMQNNLRSGRACVPEPVVRNFYSQYSPPTMNEKYKYEQIINIR